MSGAVFAAIKQSSVKDRVVEALQAAMYTGKLLPGAALLEIQLAREFHVSQTSVREALLQLEQLGLVKRIANKGTFVTKLTPAQVAERLELRMDLECMAGLQAARYINQDDEKALMGLADEMVAATHGNEYYAAAHSDLEFHRRMWLIARNETLYQVLDQVAAPLFAFVSIVRSHLADDLKKVILNSHRDIVIALVSGDSSAIRSKIETHFAGSYERFTRTE